MDHFSILTVSSSGWSCSNNRNPAHRLHLHHVRLLGLLSLASDEDNEDDEDQMAGDQDL